MKGKVGTIAAIVIGIIAVVGIFYTPYDTDQMNILLKNTPPTFLHPFGCDSFGRDVLSRVMAGLSTTFLISISIVALGGTLGTIIGSITGYYGGVVDEIMMRISDTLTAFPSILLGLLFVSVTGAGKYNIILALGILFVPSFARVARGEVARAKELDYVKNGKNMGASNWRIIFVHILPNTMPIMIPSFAIGFNNGVLAEAGMSYLGLGVQPPEASLGRMISEASGYLSLAPWTGLAPGLVMVVMIIAFSLVGERVRV